VHFTGKFVKTFITIIAELLTTKTEKTSFIMNENELSNKVIGLAIDIHNSLGPGLLESAYKECLYYKLVKSDNFTAKEKPIPLIYEDVKLDCGYRIDLLVENKLVIEIKSVDNLNDLHLAQVLTYLKLSNCKLGLLINFNVLRLKDGIKRIINGSLDTFR
jgi:GxxExxY protein